MQPPSPTKSEAVLNSGALPTALSNAPPCLCHHLLDLECSMVDFYVLIRFATKKVKTDQGYGRGGGCLVFSTGIKPLARMTQYLMDKSSDFLGAAFEENHSIAD